MTSTPPFVPVELLNWFRSKSKAAQWAMGVPTLVLLAASVAWEVRRNRSPGEPQLAIFWMIVILIVSVVLSELLRPKPNIEDARPAGLGDFQFPTATEGRVVPLLWGKVRVRGPNVVWYGDLNNAPIREKVRTGWFSKKSYTKGFKYYLGIQFAICRGPNAILRKVWIGEDVVWEGTLSGEDSFNIDQPNLFGGEDLGQGGVQATVDFYPGNLDQTVNAYLNSEGRQKIMTAGTQTAPRYSGTCHLVARKISTDTSVPWSPPAFNGAFGMYVGSPREGAYVGTSSTIKPWSFEVERYPALFPGQTGTQNKIGSDDANPINVLYELLTNREWGFGLSSADIDVGASSSFKSAADTMITEENGWSMLLDNAMQAKQLLEELQRQIDGVVFLDHRTGKWTVKLVRADYVLGSVPQLNNDNVYEVQDYTRGSWEDTTNQIQVKYSKRADEYKESYAVAQDPGNAIISGGGSVTFPVGVSASVTFPGVKNSALASNLAWRELRTQSYPLARVTLIINRESWSLRIGDVVAWTNPALGITQMPLRITRINYGKLTDNKITISCVQDVFRFADASMGTPAVTNWTLPTVTLSAYASGGQLAYEAPRAFITRDPDYAGDPNVSKVWCGARLQGSEMGFKITQRNAAGATSGAYAESGTVYAFMRIGSLTSALSVGVANPVATITISASPDIKEELEEVFDDSTTALNLGIDLTQIILVGSEFMLVRSASISGSNVNLTNVYRGALDSVQQSHAANTFVYLMFVGGGLTDTTFPNTNNVDIRLLPFSVTETFSGTPTTISFALNKRAMRPYPPNAILYNGSSTPFGAMNIEADGSGTGANIRWRRRDYRTSDEVAELLIDNTGVDASTEYRVRVFVAPSGANTEVLTSAWATGNGPVFLNRLLLWDEAPAGTEIRVRIETRHDILTETNLTSLYNTYDDVVPTSSVDGLFYLGGKLRANVESNSYTAVVSDLYTFEIESAYATSDVEVDIDGGGFVQVIPAGVTTGKYSVNAGEVVTIRHTVNETPSPNLITIDDGTGIVAYGVLKN